MNRSCFVLLMIAASSSAYAQDKPNIVLILMDNLGIATVWSKPCKGTCRWKSCSRVGASMQLIWSPQRATTMGTIATTLTADIIAVAMITQSP